MTLVSRRRSLELIAAAGLLTGSRSVGAAVPIDEQGFVPIGGIDQWLAIQGRDTANPAILFLHGGPGEAQSPFLAQFERWRQVYTVVHWDQRGSGKTYGRNGRVTPGLASPEAALQTLLQDTREVASYVMKRLSQRRILLVGQSWGAVLGLQVVKRWPELFRAFIGTGQPVNGALSLHALEAWAREQAIATGDTDTLQALDAVAELPLDDPRRRQAPRKYRFSPSDARYIEAVPNAFIGRPPFPKEGEVADWLAGFTFSIERIGAADQGFDARKLGLHFDVPIFVIQGRDDRIAPAAAAETYIGELRAPAKGFVTIAGGHWACVTNPQEFMGAIGRFV